MIQRFFEPFLRFALPELHAAARIEKEPRFLEAEFRDVLQTSEKDWRRPPSYVDYLIEVPLKAGGEQWVLLHVEIQGRGGGDLPARMDRYRCLITAHHSRYPVALALITHRRPKGEAECFERRHFGTHIRYEYNRLVLDDLADADLLASDNPFSLALYAAKCAARSQGQEDRKFLYLKELTQLLNMRGWSLMDRRDLLLFIGRIIHMEDKDNWKAYHRYLHELEGGDEMRLPKVFDLYVDEEVRLRWKEEAWAEGEAKGRAEGEAEGRAKGRAEGEAEGRAQGRAEGRAEGELLERRATACAMLREGMPPDLISHFTRLSLEELQSLAAQEK